MAKYIDRVYWDACAWIALIQREKIQTDSITEDREAMCKQVLAEAEAGRIELVTSFLSYAEVCKLRPGEIATPDKIAAFFEHEYVLPVPVDRVVGEKARSLMMSGLSGLKPPDAIHLASAAIANVKEMHTFDDKLIGMSEMIERHDGGRFKITKPKIDLPPAPLLEVVGNA